MTAHHSNARLQLQLTQYAQDFQVLLARHTDLQLRFEQLQASHKNLTSAREIWGKLGLPANDACPTLTTPEVQRAVRTLHKAACHDELTELPNRAYFSELVDERIALALRGGARFTLIHVELHRLQWIRDVDGAACADAAVIAASARLQALIRGCDLLARVDDDKLVILVSGPANEANLDEIEKRISIALALSIPFHSRRVTLRARIGHARFPQEGIGTAALLTHAESALELFPHVGHGG